MLIDHPLGLITLTIALYLAGEWIYARSGRNPFLQPVLLPIIVLVVLLKVSGLPYERYFERTTPLHFLLGPAIVALSVPLYENLRQAKSTLAPVFLSVLIGGIVVTGSALALGLLFRLERLMEIALTTKSVTVPIALAVAEKIGGVAPLTIVGVFTTGLTGITVTPLLLKWMRIDDNRVSGFTLGLTSHAFGVARSLEYGLEAVAFATLGMTLMGCASAILVPVIFRFCCSP